MTYTNYLINKKNRNKLSTLLTAYHYHQMISKEKEKYKIILIEVQKDHFSYMIVGKVTVGLFTLSMLADVHKKSEEPVLLYIKTEFFAYLLKKNNTEGRFIF